MFKIKIFQILPFWLIALFLILATQNGIFLATNNRNLKLTNQTSVPLVLGTNISIRGEPITEAVETKIIKLDEPDLKQISAKSFLVFDLNSGTNLIEKNIFQKLSIASLTKLLTSFVVYQNFDLNKKIEIDNNDVIDVKPNLGLKVGDKVMALDLFNAMLVGSSNDASLALANAVEKSTEKKFVELLNSQAQDLGMENSKFSNPMGFDNQNNYSTAEDLKKIIQTTEKLAVYRNLGRKQFYSFSSDLNNTYNATATNKLIKNHPDIEAIKTGYTLGAQGAMASKVNLKEKEIVILVLGSSNREADTLKLKTLVEKHFKW